jgi:hypothetical protein
MTEAKTLIEKLLTASQIGCKTVWVGRSGSLLLTFYSAKAAQEAAVLLSSFARNLKIGEGYDDSAKGHSKVYRVAGMMEA